MIKKVLTTGKVPVKIWTSDIEPEAEKQLEALSMLPFIHSHVAVMPDVHAGRGSTIGTVIATKGAIIPAAVGVDIGCGVAAVRLPFKVDRLGGDAKLKELRHNIERSVPTGRFGNSKITESAMRRFTDLGNNSLSEDTKVNQDAVSKLGSLGGGNHFVEICTELGTDDCWILLHSGSRNIGKRLAEVHISKAKDIMKQYLISIPDPDLAYLAQGTPEFEAYIKDLLWAQRYAASNRAELLDRVLEQVMRHVYGADKAAWQPSTMMVNCHHNYSAMENHGGHNLWVTRKGAVSAKEGELGLIPGSMGNKSYVVKGLGNTESYCSCSHGAGRRMSRTKARAIFSLEDLAKQTDGVECRKDKNIIDEAPESYKDIDEVMANQSDLVVPLHTLKQLICIKGD